MSRKTRDAHIRTAAPLWALSTVQGPDVLYTVNHLKAINLVYDEILASSGLSKRSKPAGSKSQNFSQL